MIKIKKTFFTIVIFFFCFSETKSEIKDALFASVGDKAVTHSDIINEIKIILITTGQAFSEDQKMQLEATAIKSLIKRNVKKIEIAKHEDLQFNQIDMDLELKIITNNLNIDIDTLKNIFVANQISFSILIDQIKTELLWNSLIFRLYHNRLSINLDEIDDQLKQIEGEESSQEYLISEIILPSVPSENLASEIEKFKQKIDIDGFEKVAINESISETAVRGGDLGWLNENVISKEFRSKIKTAGIGNISEPILLPEGILIFKIRDKRMVDKSLDIEDMKNQLVKSEKMKILNMHSLSHYESLRRSTPIEYY